MKELDVISAAARNRDGQLLVVEDREIFGAFGDVYDFMASYIREHKVTPTHDLLEKQFNDIELPDVDGQTPFYISELRDQYVKVKASELLEKASGKMTTWTGAQITDKLLTELSSLAKYTTTSKDTNLIDAKAAMEAFAKKKEIANLHGGTPGIATGFKSIDMSAPSGYAAGHLIVLMGYSGRMKSFFAGLSAVKAWEKGYKPMIVSLEMTPEEQAERLYPMMNPGQLNMNDLGVGDVDEDDFREWSNKKFDGASDFIIVSNQDGKDVTPNYVQAAIDKHHPDIVFLDYAQLMMDNAKSQQMTQRMMSLSRELKLLAMRNEIPIVLITAVTDEENDKRDRPPMTSQVSWSRQIEYDANMIIAIHKHVLEDAPQSEEVIIEIAGRKVRQGRLFNFYLKGRPATGEFWEDFSIGNE